MPIYAFRAQCLPTLYGNGTIAEARRLEAILNSTIKVKDRYQVDSPTDGEIALYAGRTFHIKERIAYLVK